MWAVRLAELIETLPFGTYHLTNSGQASWYDLAAEALGAAGVDADLRRIVCQKCPELYLPHTHGDGL